MYCLTLNFPFGSIETLARIYKVIKGNRGQLSIFMGITLILVMGMLAFIVNVGLFVKAKINLQNAVDAAAFSGAATQARQLTNIAYLNWEMRNTYKEWMFKYYMLGEIGLMNDNNNLTDAKLAGNNNVSFLLKNLAISGSNAATAGYDQYNIPSICVHNNSSTNICPIFNLPGIPRFDSIGVAGISEVHEAFVNKLVEKKGENCSERSQINFLAAISWAYSSGIKEIPGAPLIATNRAGAWPEALELGMRMRNLEMIVNRPPVPQITLSNVQSLGQTASSIDLNERPVKAFMSAFRNLGGGKYKDALEKSGAGTANLERDHFSESFKLTELAPDPYIADPHSVSGFLIPSSYNYPGETSVPALTKHYLDLQAVPVNFATMFSTFASMRTEYEPTVAMEASCGVSKTALPVPGYLMGFVKNPSVITYYAVKGEAEFTGLFFPRIGDSGATSFKLTAYAAAKPFGGRVGPKLFGFDPDNKSVLARGDENARSSSYISGVDVGLVGTGSTSFKPGMPIPSSQDFWVSKLTPVLGGIPEAGKGTTKYAIPNMIYDFSNDGDLAAQNSGGIGNIQIITAQMSATASTHETRGLYNSYQARTLKSAIGTVNPGTNMTADQLMRALVTARQVTKYDAANYLIPDMRTPNSNRITNAAPTVKPMASLAVQGGRGVYYKIFAPLVGTDMLYKTNSEVASIVGNYISNNESAINIYLSALLDVANSIFALPTGKNTTSNINILAARSIHINAGTAGGAVPPLLVSSDPLNSTDPTCVKDMASKFNHFFNGKNTQCGIVPLESLMVEYIDKKNRNDGGLYYATTYYNPIPDKIMTAYYPGPRQGTAQGDSEATSLGPIGTDVKNYSTRRNYYSTKFIPLSKVLSDANDYKNNVYLESDTTSPTDVENVTVQNLIPKNGASGLSNSYFSDF
jgi:hypothetical protein